MPPPSKRQARASASFGRHVWYGVWPSLARRSQGSTRWAAPLPPVTHARGQRLFSPHLRQFTLSFLKS